jgi:predicted MFS family arabinose efflux permease
VGNLRALGARAATQSFDAPARQSWVPLLVSREFVGNAIGLNSVAFNGPSVLGPPLAGALILTVGVQMAFYFNALSTLAVIVALVMMRPAPPSSAAREPMLQAMGAGARFLFNHPVLRSVVGLLVVTCICVRPYSQLMPAYAAHVVHVDARGLGLLLAASGVGAIGGSIITAVIGARRRGVVWFVSALVMSLSSMLLGITHVFVVALGILVVLGMAVLSFAGSSNVLLQTLAPDEMRGRAISVFSMIMLGFVPLGSLALGSVATLIGLPRAMVLGGAVSLVLAMVVFMKNAALRDV